MNRRDAALIAHLDAVEARWTARLDAITARLDTITARIDGLRLDLARHIAEGHGGER